MSEADSTVPITSESGASVQPSSGFDTYVLVVSVLSVLISFLPCLGTCLSLVDGFYGGTALMIFCLVIVQASALLVLIGLPVLGKFFFGTLWLSRRTKILLGAAVICVIFEALGVWLIPVTSNC